MKKKMIAGIIAAMMTVGMVMPVSAETTSVTYTQNSDYTVTIPATTLSGTTETDQTVSATMVNIVPGKKLQVMIKGITNGIVTLTRDDGAATTTTTVSKSTGGADVINGDTVIAEFEGQSTDFVNGTTGKLYFSAIPENTAAGSYEGTITYTLDVVDK